MRIVPPFLYSTRRLPEELIVYPGSQRKGSTPNWLRKHGCMAGPLPAVFSPLCLLIIKRALFTPLLLHHQVDLMLKS